MVTITISGSPGSGKTTAAKLLAEKLKLKYFYVGDIFREMAEKHKMSLEEFGRYCEKHREIDQQLDDYQLKVLAKGDVIVEGRISGWIAYRNNIHAVKVLIDTDIGTRVKRILKREGGAFSERKKEMLNREKSEMTRYKKYYNIDLKDNSIYDVVIDSGDKTPEEIVDIIVKKIK